MPTQWAHRMYWATPSTVTATPVVGVPGYPIWQISPVTAMGIVFGPPVKEGWQATTRAAHDLRIWTRDQLRRFWRYVATWLYPKEEAALLNTVARAVVTPHWPEAKAIVRQTATTIGFNRPEAWVQLNRAIKADPGQAENTFRHLRSVHELRKVPIGSTIGNPDAHLAIELAYQGFRVMGR